MLPDIAISENPVRVNASELKVASGLLAMLNLNGVGLEFDALDPKVVWYCAVPVDICCTWPS